MLGNVLTYVGELGAATAAELLAALLELHAGRMGPLPR